MTAAARARNMPLVVVDVQTCMVADIPAAYTHKLVLCRADQHVVWRGDSLPIEPSPLVAWLCGEGSA